MIRQFLSLLRKDDLMSQALAECHEMIDLCHTMVHASMDSLRKREDASTEIDLAEADRKLNSFERDVRRKVMTHLSLRNNSDVVSGLVLVSVVIDLERIGDYTKNIHGLARNHPARLDAGPYEERLQQVEKSALAIFDRTVAAFKEGDSEEARQLMEEYKYDISRPYADLEEELVSAKNGLPTSSAVTLALYLRFLKRIAAHSRNLISSVVNPFDRIGYSE